MTLFIFLIGVQNILLLTQINAGKDY